jgi:hypothetical protein
MAISYTFLSKKDAFLQLVFTFFQINNFHKQFKINNLGLMDKIGGTNLYNSLLS